MENECVLQQFRRVTFEVKEVLDKGFGATFRPPMGPGRRPDGGAGGEVPGG